MVRACRSEEQGYLQHTDDGVYTDRRGEGRLRMFCPSGCLLQVPCRSNSPSKKKQIKYNNKTVSLIQSNHRPKQENERTRERVPACAQCPVHRLLQSLDVVPCIYLLITYGVCAFIYILSHSCFPSLSSPVVLMHDDDDDDDVDVVSSSCVGSATQSPITARTRFFSWVHSCRW